MSLSGGGNVSDCRVKVIKDNRVPKIRVLGTLLRKTVALEAGGEGGSQARNPNVPCMLGK